MGPAIWCNIVAFVPVTCGDCPAVIDALGEALCGCVHDVADLGDGRRRFGLAGEANHGLCDGRVEDVLGWLSDDQVPFTARDEFESAAAGGVVVFDGDVEIDRCWGDDAVVLDEHQAAAITAALIGGRVRSLIASGGSTPIRPRSTSRGCHRPVRAGSNRDCRGSRPCHREGSPLACDDGLRDG